MAGVRRPVIPDSERVWCWCPKCGEETPRYDPEPGRNMGRCIPCKKRYTEQYRMENPPAYSGPEPRTSERLAYEAEWRAVNREHLNEQARLRLDKDREAHNAYLREWRAANPGSAYASTRKWIENNREQTRELKRESNRRRKARLLENDYEPYKDDDIFDRDDWTCLICFDPIDRMLPRNSRYGATIDHIIPISEGGADAPHNVQAAHWICNIRKGPRGRRPGSVDDQD